VTTPASLIDVPLTGDLVHGAVDLEPTDRGLLPVRLPAWARAQVGDPQLTMAASQPSGVRLVLRTAATAIELDTVPTKRLYAGAPPRPDGVYEVLADDVPTASGTVTGGDTLHVDMGTGEFRHERGEPGTLRLTGLAPHDKRVEIWLPHDETTELVALRADAAVRPEPATGRRRWVHHGSSISQGSNATTPLGTWPAVAARLAGVDLVNLGYGGGALLDPAVARTVRDAAGGLGAGDLMSLELGINVVNADLMRRRAFGSAVHGFLDLVRDGNPTVPLLVVTPVACPIHEDTPGPSAPDLAAIAEGRMAFRATGDPKDVASGALTLGVVRDELARVVDQRRADDPALQLLDGRRLYGGPERGQRPLPDGLHPDAETHREMGERFARLGLTTGACG
jgi:hypothetical protein